MNDLLVILLIAIILFYEEIKLTIQIIYNAAALFVKSIVEPLPKLQEEIAFALVNYEAVNMFIRTDTESIKEYQEGCNFDNLNEEEEISDWKEEIRSYLNCYTPLIFTEFLLTRIEELMNEN